MGDIGSDMGGGVIWREIWGGDMVGDIGSDIGGDMEV